jgi:hypothetical protein
MQINIRELREQHERAKRGDREKLREAHERGIQAVKNSEMSYRQAVAMKLHGTPPGPPPSSRAGMYGTGGVNPAGVAEDPLFGHEAVMRRGRGPIPDPDSTFRWS